MIALLGATFLLTSLAIQNAETVGRAIHTLWRRS